jgi:nucleotide-binding universal stress UspA family protein
MQTFFSNILVPVDFSLNTQLAVEKARWLAAPGFSIIHLLHIQKPASKSNEYNVNGFIMPVTEAGIYITEDAEAKLQQLKENLEASLRDVVVVTHLRHEENVQRGITFLAKQLNPSLIIIGEGKAHKWLPFLKKVNTSVLA